MIIIMMIALLQAKVLFCFEVLLRVHSQDTSKEKQLIIINNLPICFCLF